MTTKRVAITLVLECRDDVPGNICDWMCENLAEHAYHEFCQDFEPAWHDDTYMHEPLIGPVTARWAQRREPLEVAEARCDAVMNDPRSTAPQKPAAVSALFRRGYQNPADAESAITAWRATHAAELPPSYEPPSA
jgi:hypothetical protein